MFAWLRPDDLIWNYWLNNYLQGKPPPAFDILYWNADTTRMPAGLHRDFIDIGMANALTKPGAASMLGSPVDLSKINVDSYVVAAIDDHISPWPSAYPATQLLGGTKRFVLSNSGHIAAMVNPPSNPKATFRLASSNPPDHRDWLAQAETVQGSWWPDFTSWLAGHSGDMKESPASWAVRSSRHWSAPGHTSSRRDPSGRPRRWLRCGRPGATGRGGVACGAASGVGTGQVPSCRRCRSTTVRAGWSIRRSRWLTPGWDGCIPAAPPVPARAAGSHHRPARCAHAE